MVKVFLSFKFHNKSKTLIFLKTVYRLNLTKNPYYPYNQELFGHNEEDTPDLAENWFSYLSGLHKGQNAIMFTLGEVSIIVLMMLLLKIPHDYSQFIVAFNTIWLFGLKTRTKPLPLLIGVKKKKNQCSLFTIHYSLITVHCYCLLCFFYLFKGGCPLC